MVSPGWHSARYTAPLAWEPEWGLYVGIIGAEQFFGAIDSELFDHVNVFAAAVIAFARVAFGIFIGQYRTLRLQHPGADVVFRCDQLDVFFLPGPLPLHGLVEYVVVPCDFHVFIEHTSPYNIHVKAAL